MNLNQQKRLLLCSLIALFFYSTNLKAQTVDVTGELKKWHKVTVSLTLPGNNLTQNGTTFEDRRMDVVFTSPSGNEIRVPGFFAADGNAANTNASQGKIFKAFLRPNETGTWTYRVLYYSANNVAISNVNNLPSPEYNLTGTVGSIENSDKSAPDFRAKGRLQYQNTGTNSERRYLRFAETGEYFLKLGPDSPENLLNYNEFDTDAGGNVGGNFTPRHSYNPHAANFQSGDPTWDGGKGKNIIGAVNYLKDQQMNSMSMSLFGGDDRNVFPWTKSNQRTIFDISKLEQWEIVFDHAEKNGLLLHFKLAENENWDALNLNLLKLYYREMVARFGHHLAVEWNISEEYRGAPASAIARIDWLAAIDPWQNHRVIHTYPGEHSKYTGWLNLDAKLTGASIQSGRSNNYKDAYNGNSGILTWINNSKNDGTPWVVASDEQNPGSEGVFTSVDINNNNVKVFGRTRILWKTLIAGGAGVMWYGGAQGDFRTENFNRFGTLFQWSRYAILDFFKGNNLKFWEMSNNDNLVSGNSNHCLANAGDTYVIYLENGGSTNLNLNGQNGNYTVKWFNPRNGGNLLNGSVTSISGNGTRSIGNPPNNNNSDWVALVTNNSNNNDPVSVTGISVTPNTVSLNTGETVSLTANVLPSNATNQSVTWSSNNTSLATVNNNGVVNTVAEGTVIITATSVDGSFTATSTIAITEINTTPIAVTGVSVTPTSVSLNTNQTANLTANVLPSNAANQSLTWSSNNASIATVNSNGVVTAVAAGLATITATTVDGGFTATSLITVIGNNNGGTQETVNLTPINDSYLQNSTNFNVNIIRIEKNRRVGYLMFDVSSISGTITDAKLEFTVASDRGNGNINVNLGTSNNWTETTLNNSNKPSSGTLLGTLNDDYAIGSTKTVDLTGLTSINGNQLSLIVSATSGNDFAFGSKENNAKPKLILTTSAGTAKKVDAVFGNIKLYPNPATDFIALKGIIKKDKVSIVDLSGKFYDISDSKITNGEFVINISSFPKGIYFIKINNNKKTVRFIKK